VNEVQHNASVEYSRAKARIRLKEHELASAVAHANTALDTLRTAVNRDPNSWYGTPDLHRNPFLPEDLVNRDYSG